MEGASFLLAVLFALVLLVGVVLGLFVLAVLVRLVGRIGLILTVLHGFASIKIRILLFCAIIQDLSFGLQSRAARKPKNITAEMPPAAAFSPPVSTPSHPSSCTACFTPLARL